MATKLPLRTHTPRRIARALAAAATLALGAGLLTAAPASAATPQYKGYVRLSTTTINTSTFSDPKVKVTIPGYGRYVWMEIYHEGDWREQDYEYAYDPSYTSTVSTTEEVSINEMLETIETPLSAGTYKIRFTTRAEENTVGESYYSITAATSPVLTLNIAKRKTKVQNWSTKALTVTQGSRVSERLITVAWPEEDNSLQLQKRVVGGTWSTKSRQYATYDSSTQKTFTFPVEKKPGTYEYRINVQGTKHVTGTVSSTLTVTVKATKPRIKVKTPKKVDMFTPVTITASPAFGQTYRLQKWSKKKKKWLNVSRSYFDGSGMKSTTRPTYLYENLTEGKHKLRIYVPKNSYTKAYASKAFTVRLRY